MFLKTLNALFLQARTGCDQYGSPCKFVLSTARRKPLFAPVGNVTEEPRSYGLVNMDAQAMRNVHRAVRIHIVSVKAIRMFPSVSAAMACCSMDGASMNVRKVFTKAALIVCTMMKRAFGRTPTHRINSTNCSMQEAAKTSGTTVRELAYGRIILVGVKVVVVENAYIPIGMNASHPQIRNSCIQDHPRIA
ncbi:hypothetical protein Tcan_08784 [Toxocara canis]|uniref:Uncharacterized protein n=1 Tax=Toxocara canis TaxID=6265 RepID=A0A0B2UYI9_TOXCA|nr:hypothetical protein Tcan_08784 [Toxocara canis]